MLTAAARKVDLEDGSRAKADIGRRQSWQTEAWDYFHEVPEISFGVTWLANAVSKVVFYAGWRNEDGTVVPINSDKAEGVPAGLADVAVEQMNRLRDEVGGQSRIAHLSTLSIEVVGEFFLHGIAAKDQVGVPGEDGYEPAEPERWAVRSISEIRATTTKDEQDRDVVELVTEEGGKPRPIDNDRETLIRVWQEDPQWSTRAWCHLRACMSDAELLVLLINQQKAESKSKQAPGILLIPSELSFTEDALDDEGAGGEPADQPQQNPFIAALLQAITEPIEDPSSSASVMPLVITGPKEYLHPDGLRLLTFARTSDEHLDKRIEARINRLARGMNVPVEVVLGHMSTTFSNASQIDQDAYEDHAEPRVSMLADAYRFGFLIPNIVAAAPMTDPALLERVVVGVETGLLTTSQTAEANAEALWSAGVISSTAYRRLLGADDEDAPTIEEQLFNLAARKGILTADVFVALMTAAGVDLGVTINPESSQAVITEDGAPAADPPADPVTAAGRRFDGARLGRQLAAIDRQLRDRLHGAVEAAAERALERAGNKIKSKLTASAATATGRADASGARLLAKETQAKLVASTIETRYPGALTAAGFTTDDLLAGAWEDFGRLFKLWVTQGGDSALELVSQSLSGMTAAQRDTARLRMLRSIDDAWAWLEDALGDAGQAILLNPDRGVVNALDSVGEWAADVRVPPGLIREALALAGGVTGMRGTPGVLTPTGSAPIGGVATGEIVTDTIRESGYTIEAYRWVYGPGRRATFRPHMRLDGTLFTNFDDPALINGSTWPPNQFFYPGDHRGCLCDFEPVLIEGDQVVAAVVSPDANVPKV